MLQNLATFEKPEILPNPPFLYLSSDFSNFFLFSLFWWDISPQSVKIAFRDKNGQSACIWVLGVAGGVTPTRADHLFLPEIAIFFNNMVELIKTNIWSYHLLKSVNKRKNGELNRFFASLLCPESPHPIFFFNFFFLFFFLVCFLIKNNGLKFQIDILKKTLIRTWGRDPPFIMKSGSGLKYP